MVLAAGGAAAPYAMLELWATIVGDLIEYQVGGVRYTSPVGRKHAPAAAQGNTALVPSPTEWRAAVHPTRFLMVESNDMDQYTTRTISSLLITCDGGANALGSDFDVWIHGIELTGPKGNLTIESFDH
eukprot:gene49285-35477_t